MKVIKCTQLQDEYHGIKNYDRYHNFNEIYNKNNEKNRMLVEQKIINPVSIFQSKIKLMVHGNDSDNGGRGGCVRGQLGGRGRGGRSGGRDRGRR